MRHSHCYLVEANTTIFSLLIVSWSCHEVFLGLRRKIPTLGFNALVWQSNQVGLDAGRHGSLPEEKRPRMRADTSSGETCRVRHGARPAWETGEQKD